MAEAKRKLEVPTHHPDTGLPFVEPPDDIRKLIRGFNISPDTVRCYVKSSAPKDTTASGLVVMPENTLGQNQKEGWIVKAGPSAKLELWNAEETAMVEYQLRSGDFVTFGKYSGAVSDRHDRGERDLKVLNGVAGEGDVLGVISHGRMA